ncbi:hypothetical protein [Halopiger xanaduensis]|uniref:Uncharacterized protein n=1 Tax=Halopiger xanaduensis (strain DSM 18323 / JCM 14033 / SH-6) TaxID=797210 RepID=F8D7X0_HALXS|nr:hypothetical protein [Halopiger xanaduensis]AEH36701.1 hypothetical protein Halxa_2076 [Halopiger xanaduensis SH-6]
MGARTDAGLTGLVLAATIAAFVRVGAPVSWPAAVLGGAGTLAFELVAARDPELVREYWEQRIVQVAAVILAVVVIIVGARVAPAPVLSAIAGALVTYLGFLVIVTVAVGTRHSRHER